MYEEDPGLEQRLSRFEAQLDRFSLALHQWQAHDHAQSNRPVDVDQRIRNLEETLDREAHALRQMHEEPLKQLQAQAASLQDLYTAASHSVSGLDQAELRLTELQAHVGLLVNQLSRSLQALSELHGVPVTTPATRSEPAAWPLDRVVDLHEELRRTGNENGNGDASGATAQDDAPGGTTNKFLKRIAVGVPPPPDDTAERARRLRLLVTGAGALVFVVLSVFLIRWFVGRLDDAAAKVASAERQVVATTQLANKEVSAAREDANKQIAEARQLAQRAETVGAILTAPDLIRFNLTSLAADGSSAQVLWSRTRGIVLSGSRLPQAAPESTYQLWLVTSAQPVSAGVFVPDATGRATLVVDSPPKVAGPVVGAGITVEPQGGRLTPTGQMLLARFP